MSRFRIVVLSCLCGLPTNSYAAEISRLASSFEEDNPLGLFLDAQFEHRIYHSNILREVHQNSRVENTPELLFKRVDNWLNLDVRIGLFRDLEFRYQLPIALRQTRSWTFSPGKDNSNSSIYNNCISAEGSLRDPSCPLTGSGQEPLFAVPAQSYRAGLDNMTFGLAYALMNQRKQEHLPTWIWTIDYVAPTARVLNPSEPTSQGDLGPVGDGFHRYKFMTTFSKRMGVFDPYVQLHYTLPWKGPHAYSNCDTPNSPSLGRPENCGQEGWLRSETVGQAPHLAGVIAGSEINLFEDSSLQSKLAFDLRAFANYVSAGRYYNELSDVFGKLLRTQEYLHIGAQVGLVAYAADYLHFKAHASWARNTDHFLTYEEFGKDLNGNGAIDLTGVPNELNPQFDWRADMVSRRFRTGNSQHIQFNVTATVAF